MTMKKTQLLVLLLTSLSLFGSGHTSDDSKNSESGNGSHSGYVADDETEKTKPPVNSYEESFETYESLKSYLNGEFSLKQEERFYSIFPQKINDGIGAWNSFSVLFDVDNPFFMESGSEKILSNPRVCEFFRIYDEDLETGRDFTLDGLYSSMSFNCVFFPMKSDQAVPDFRIEDISASKVKITFESGEDVLGYAYVCFGIYVDFEKVNTRDYIKQYLNENLRPI